ncbi:Hypothetical protein R9X50_00428100 [Acrodontium crateriforme]|uniref:Membrane anchor Opy2 N-terminal domain-containing protein n=1 Tax=Acrodontium crateriforme TaxID=150365 RepID=A0AAQ3M517_9PEZI|nr:Hypothetical protein R9X50_00428100 [Acrodontium crateriforme]
MRFDFLTSLALALPSMALKLPVHRNDWEGHVVKGDCCLVWDFVDNRCLQGSKGWRVERMAVCPSMLEPPTVGVPKDCFIWSTREKKCKEKDDGRLDGLNYTPEQESSEWVQKWWKFVDKVYGGQTDKIGHPKSEPEDKWKAIIDALPPPPKPTVKTWSVATQTPTHPYICKSTPSKHPAWHMGGANVPQLDASQTYEQSAFIINIINIIIKGPGGLALSTTMAGSRRRTVNYEVERALRTIFKRCVLCEPGTPTCGTCSTNEVCSLVPQDCNTCSHTVCIANPNPAPSTPGPNVGAIAGGVIGGVLAVVIVVFFVWRFWIKKRRAQQELEAEEWDTDEIAQQKATPRFNNYDADALSTRTRGSIANSFLSRASNIIQIAYIPGVTNRNGSGRDSLLDSAPVPPVPASMRNSQPQRSPLSNQGDALFFRPGDLRDSTYSNASFRSNHNRDTQYTMKSITPSLARSSIASEIYRDDAKTEPMPATTVIRAAPRMVSVKSSQASTPSESASTSQASSLFQVVVPGEGKGVTPTSSLRGKATQVTVGGKGKGRFPVRNPSDSSAGGRHAPSVSSPLVDGAESTDDEDEHARARQSYPNATTPPRVQPAESPFYDASEGTSKSPPKSSTALIGSTSGLDNQAKRGVRGMGGLSAVIEEATKRASSSTGPAAKREISPFDDKNVAE